MSTLPQQNTINQYSPTDGVTDTFNYTFLIPSDDDIEVYVTLADATPIPADDIQELNVAYTVTGAGVTAGGTIVFNPTYIPAIGSTVTLSRNVIASLVTDFSNAQTFSGATLDTALQRNMLVSQQNQTYSLQRNLSYVVNSDLGATDPEISSNTQLQRLQEGYIWQGTASGGVASVLLQQPADVSTLRSELANDAPITNGASLVGYYDTVNLAATNVSDFLNNLIPFIEAQLGLTGKVVLPGTIIDFGGTVVPDGYLGCDGSAVSRTTYADLFTAIGTTWGVGDASTTFNVPDFRRSVAVGSGGSGTGTLAATVGSVGGAETHTMTTGELVAHTHTFHDNQNFYGNSSAALNFGAGGTNFGLTNPTGTTDSTGTTTPFNIIQPSAVTLKCIKT